MTTVLRYLKNSYLTRSIIRIKQTIINYLAHAYLSFGNPGVLVGNMISDFVKGKSQFGYSDAIQKGIQLHRYIDTYTDTHAATKELKAFFRPQYRLYAGAFADVVYDYFLANDRAEFESDDTLTKFAAGVYTILQEHINVVPAPFAKMVPWMQQQDWLGNYRFAWGIEKSFGGVVRRSAYLTEHAIAFDIFMKNQAAMQPCYNAFFTDLKKQTIYQLQELLKT